MIEIAVCDDEPRMLLTLSEAVSGYLDGQGAAGRVRAFPSGQALLESGLDFDLLFLDIRMDGPDGFESARRLRERGSRALLVFVTALGEQVYDAFPFAPFDYLVKPLDPARFARTMARALRVLERRAAARLVIRRAGGCCEIVPFSELVYCEVQGRKVYLHRSGGGVLDYYDRLDALARRLDSRFFRCHRSYLVNLEYVRGCGGGRVTLSRGGVENVPLSRLRERELSEALLRFLKER